jgi:glutamate racemase
MAEGWCWTVWNFWLRKALKALVIACNPATTPGYEASFEAFDMPVIVVIEPGVRPLAK